MKELYIIPQLLLENGILKSKVGRSTKKVHYRQGELDGACGAYSVAIALNIIGAFDADFINSPRKNVDLRTSEGKLYNIIHRWGLFPDGLKTDECITILETFKKSSYKLIEATEINADIIKSYLDNNTPIILLIEYKGGAHWIIVIGYELKNKRINNFYVIDPGCELPSSAYWNGVINMKKIRSAHYCYAYNATNWNAMVSIGDAISIYLK